MASLQPLSGTEGVKDCEWPQFAEAAPRHRWLDTTCERMHPRGPSNSYMMRKPKIVRHNADDIDPPGVYSQTSRMESPPSKIMISARKKPEKPCAQGRESQAQRASVLAEPTRAIIGGSLHPAVVASSGARNQ
ncbi:hypothetical protein M747DRAFT_249496 [Aspergillus niger ATCC 13496]|uniref:Uncharacterized protein n=3 Tax=Aspergillus niger TaxID=5061 RepID=A2R9Y3_ASPNC|nr:hypothetical protein An18g00640 [Aspergillus niger]RDH14448.1 hypothetical protein M747DRAFT_249496 [Aspergillus niger ATCC 13496]CAK43139.1 hypothetical protein An18g00640 [Aspergillus niger]